MDAKQVRYFCAEYGEWFARSKYKGLYLGFNSEDVFYRLIHGKISFDKHQGSRELSIEETPKQYVALEYLIERMKSRNRDLWAVFVMHWCVFFINKKRANIRMKAKDLEISQRCYYERLSQAMAIINFYFVDFPVLNDEWIHTQLKVEFEKIP